MKPGRRGPHEGPPFLTGQNHHRIGLLIACLALILIAALVAYLVVRMTNRRTPSPALVVPAGAPIQDAALQQLRLRYARGEINRSDYLQAAADLGAPPQVPEPPPTNVL